GKWRSNHEEEQECVEEHTHILDDMGHQRTHHTTAAAAMAIGSKRKSLLDLQNDRFERKQRMLQWWILAICVVFIVLESCCYALIPELPKPSPSDAKYGSMVQRWRQWWWWQWNGDIVLSFWLPIFL